MLIIKRTKKHRLFQLKNTVEPLYPLIPYLWLQLSTIYCGSKIPLNDPKVQKQRSWQFFKAQEKLLISEKVIILHLCIIYQLMFIRGMYRTCIHVQGLLLSMILVSTAGPWNKSPADTGSYCIRTIWFFYTKYLDINLMLSLPTWYFYDQFILLLSYGCSPFYLVYLSKLEMLQAFSFQNSLQ